jgi:FkbM family methyltransferase
LSRAAVGGRNEQGTLYDSGFPGLSSFIPASDKRGIPVNVITLEELLNRSGLTQVDLLKMDIEGAETQVFETVSTATLRRIRAAVIECHPEAGADITLIQAKLIEAGMQTASDPRMVVAWRT